MATRAAALFRASIARALNGHRLKSGAARFLCRTTTTTTSSFQAKLTPLAFIRTKQTQSHHLSHNSTNAHPAHKEPLSSMAASPTILEVERKFTSTPTSLVHLLTAVGVMTDADGVGGARFRSLVPLQPLAEYTDFQDVYFDTPQETLGRAGVWLRRREWCGYTSRDRYRPRLEAKVRVGGDYTNSAFEEITDVARIAALLAELVPGAEVVLRGRDAGPEVRGGGMGVLASFQTHRRKFLADGRFTIVLDTTDFGHAVGEVELERELPAGVERDREGEGKEGGYDKAAVVAEMDHDIDAFMKSYPWAIPPGEPVGKLSAYFAKYPVKKM